MMFCFRFVAFFYDVRSKHHPRARSNTIASSAPLGSLVTATVPPQIMPFTFGESAFNKGDSTGVSCMIVKGDLPLAIRWRLNGAAIASNGDVSVIAVSPKTSVLNIAAVDREHRGRVECIASNAAGSARFASDLRVNGV